VKIAEGCNNRCSYCLIPTLRGPLRNRPVADILAEVRNLAKRGVKEVIFVAQDTTAHSGLPKILSGAAGIKGLRWLRVMYAHPAHVTDQLLAVMKKERKIVKYLDLPIQHCNDKILRLMRRRYARQDLETLIQTIRRKLPNLALRTTVIAGFPGEGEAELQELLGFLKRVKFAKLGCFTFCREPGTPAFRMRKQVPARVKQLRRNRIMRLQAQISKEMNSKLIGQILEILIEKGAAGRFVGRSPFDAPEIDGRVIIRSAKRLSPGQVVRARITGARTHDLLGVVN
jgi:ribosomal protein S12 methylthiotransferase